MPTDSVSNRNHQPNSKIVDVYYHLPGYLMQHGSTYNNNRLTDTENKEISRNEKLKYFVGREKVEKSIEKIFEKNVTGKGVYLITGYRGMGKTSLVKKVIYGLNSKSQSSKVPRYPNTLKSYFLLSILLFFLSSVVTVMSIFLGTNQYELHCPMTLVDLYINIATKNEIVYYLLLFISVYFTISSFIFLTDCFSSLQRRKRQKFLKYQSFEMNLGQPNIADRDVIFRVCEELLRFWKSQELLFAIFPFKRPVYSPFRLFLNLFKNKRLPNEMGYFQIYQRLTNLHERFIADTTTGTETSQGFQGNSTFQSYLPYFASVRKNSSQLPKINSKEAESILIQILDDISYLREKKGDLHIPQLIFIFDELDKIERTEVNTLNNTETNFQTESSTKSRQLIISQLLGSLKGFLSSSNAMFFFVGGQELFDADLADISDRDSSISSIVNQVIYLDSFYKESGTTSKAGITQMTTTYLLKLLMEDDSSRSTNDISEYANYIRENNTSITSDNEKKGLILLQNYIIFLAYRSTGSPRKLTQLIEKKIHKVEGEQNNLICLGKQVCGESINHSDDDDDNYYIRLSYNDQYEINLTCDLYRPYSIYNQRHQKNLSDKLLYATPFIFDHILKFYSHGFSYRNLELIPEVTLAAKEPTLVEHLDGILKFLVNFQIKDTFSGIFEYKFHSIIKREIMVLSKLSSLSSAAFNFTLDESLKVKKYFENKLALRQAKLESSQKNEFTHSIFIIQTVLGNLSFYDQAYDDALLYYTESIQSLRIPNDLNKINLNRHQFYLLIQNKLKVALVLEKIRAYESAISYYKSLIKIIVSKGKDYDYLDYHLVVTPFYALLACYEKNRVDGITKEDVDSIKDQITNLLTYSYKSELTRVQFLLYDYFNNLGSILYFKNNKYINSDPAINSSLEAHLNAIKYLLGRIIELDKYALWDALISETSNVFGSSGRRKYYIALSLLKIGDIKLSELQKIQLSISDINSIQTILITKIWTRTNFVDLFNKLDQNTFSILTIYLLSYRYFRDSGNIFYQVQSLKRVLYCFKEAEMSKNIKLSIDEKGIWEIKLFRVTQILATEIIHSVSLYNSNTNLPQINKFKTHINNNNNNNEPKSFKSVSNISELRELELIVNRIRLKHNRNSTMKNIRSRYISLNKHDIVRPMYYRILELKYQMELNYFLIKSQYLELCELISIKTDQIVTDDMMNTFSNNREDIKQIILDSFFCLRESIRLLELYKPGYTVGYLSLATAHYRAASWINFSDKLLKSEEHWDENIKNVIGSNSFNFKDVYYQIESALSYYKKTIELHSEGREYKAKIKELYALEDDYNDTLMHFTVAMERQRMASGYIDQKITELSEILVSQNSYRIDNDQLFSLDL